MIIHFSILGVILVASLLFDSRTTYYKKKNKDYIMPVLPWLMVFGYLAFLSAMRSGMNDTSAYVSSFESCEGSLKAGIQGFLTADVKYRFTILLENLFKAYISENYHMWFLAFAVVESIAFIHVFRRECYGVMVPCFFFFASALYYNYFSMMRQWMAVAIVFWGFEWLKNKKWIQYFLCCILAAQFHPSAYICIIFSVMAVGKPWRRKQNFIIMSSVILLIFLNPILSKMEEAAEGTAYDYAIATMQTSSGSSPVRIVIAIVPVLLAFYCRKYIDSENDRAMEICVNMSVLNCLLNVIASFTSGLYVIRLATYLNPYNVILYSYLLKKVVRGRNQKVFLVGFYMFYFAFYCYQMTHQGAWGYSSDILGKFY